MRFFFDNNLAPRLARAIDALLDRPDQAIHLLDRFPPDVTDQEWLTTLGRAGGWIVISGDLRIARSAHERKAWQDAGLTAFFLKKGWSQPLWLQASRLMQWWPDIVAQARRVQPGAGFLVPFRYTGRFEQPRLS